MGVDPGGPADVLAGSEWSCTSSPPGVLTGPGDHADLGRGWLAAAVPGTVAGALRAVGASEVEQERLDGQDWWFRCRFPGPDPASAPHGWILECDGLATVSDIWLNGDHLLRSESMFAPHAVPVRSRRAPTRSVTRLP